MTRLKNNRIPFAVSLMLALAGIGLVLSANHALQARHRTALRIPRKVIEGQHTFSLRHPGGCFGEVRTGLEPEDDFLSYTLNATATILLNGKQQRIRVHGFVQINSLEQIFASLFILELAGNRWQLGTTGAVPITWNVRPLSVENAIDQSGTIPGPLTVRSVDSAFFQISHPFLSALQPQSSSPLLDRLGSLLPVTIAETPCENELSPLPLDPLLRQLGPLIQKTQFFVG